MSRALLSASRLQHAPGLCALCAAPAACRLQRLSHAGLQVRALACVEHERDVEYALYTAGPSDVARRVRPDRRARRAKSAEYRAHALAAAAERAWARKAALAGTSVRGAGPVVARICRHVVRLRAVGLLALARALRRGAP